jgi:hypothetical protein
MFRPTTNITNFMICQESVKSSLHIIKDNSNLPRLTKGNASFHSPITANNGQKLVFVFYKYI